jgi:hypothetical protein
MNNQSRPNSTDRIISHLIVGLAVGLLVARKAGASGLVFGALLAMGAHEALDAPMAVLVADVTQ